MGYPPLKEEADASSGSLTSYELLERAHFRLMRTARRSADALTLEEVLAVWHELGFEVARQLRARRGVRLPGLGTFAMAKTGAPFFALDAQFQRRYGADDVAAAAATGSGAGRAPGSASARAAERARSDANAEVANARQTGPAMKNSDATRIAGLRPRSSMTAPPRIAPTTAPTFAAATTSATTASDIGTSRRRERSAPAMTPRS